MGMGWWGEEGMGGEGGGFVGEVDEWAGGMKG